jgi:hypothetical protein
LDDFPIILDLEIQIFNHFCKVRSQLVNIIIL